MRIPTTVFHRTFLTAGRILLLTMVLLPALSVGQTCTLRGSVRDDTTGELLEFVNVFLANTTRGTSTDAHGLFTLSGIPAGMHDLVVSQVGYRRLSQRIVLTVDTVCEVEFRLHPKELRTAEVEVRGMDPALSAQLLKQFSAAFLGETENAESCRILNPNRLDLRFDPDRRLLMAACDTFLLVRNDALGYSIAIDIEEFTYNGSDDEVRYSLFPRFQPLTGSSEDSLRWADRRGATYRGSFKHFLSSLVSGTWEKEMFAVYAGSFSALSRGMGEYASAQDIPVVPDEPPGTFRISFQGWLRVEYAGRIPRTTSYLTLLGRDLRVDAFGNPLTRFGTRTAGAWSFYRVADMLPLY